MSGKVTTGPVRPEPTDGPRAEVTRRRGKPVAVSVIM